MAAALQVLDVSAATQPTAQLRGFAIEHPRPGAIEEPGGYALRVEGWALGAQQPLAAIELVHDDEALWRLVPEVERPDVLERHGDLEATARCGFAATIGTLALPSEFELEVVAVLADDARVGLGAIRGRRDPLRSAFEPQLQPLLVTALGRTGSTIVMRLLAAHPQVVAYRPFEYEPRVASYWIDVLRELSEPASYRRQFSPAGSLKNRGWWLGGRSSEPPSIPERELGQWLDARAPEQIAAFCQARIEALYARIAERGERGGALYFAEKYRPSPSAALVRELYPSAKEVFLVRDFRDMVASMFAYNEKRGVQGFRRDRSNSDVDYVLSEVAPGARALARAWGARRSASHLLRYEDLVREPAQTITGVLDYLGLDGGEPAVRSLLSSFEPEATFEMHGTSPSPRESIDRWRRDLSDELQQACADAFRSELEAFGYLPDGRAPA